jgi:hypothetical protein
MLLRGLSMVRNDEELLALSGPIFGGLYEYRKRRSCSDGSRRDHVYQ